MRHAATVIASLVLYTTILAGCTQPGDNRWTLTVTDAPPTAQVGEEVAIAWTIAGPAGATEHTDVHFGLVSTSNKKVIATQDYDAASPHKTGGLPGSYETTFTITFPGIIYFRAHLLVGDKHYWSDEKIIQVTGTPVEVTDLPDKVEAGSTATVTWRVEHLKQTEIPHTAIHYGPVSHPDTQDPFAYPNMTPKPAHSGTVPGTFSAVIAANEPGTIYFKAHAVIGGQNFVSVEQTIRVVNPSKPNVIVLDYPKRVKQGDEFNVTFQVNAPMIGVSTDVGIVWDNETHEANRSKYHQGPSTPAALVPGKFTMSLMAEDAGDLYFRAYYQAPGDNVTLSDESKVTVVAKEVIDILSAPTCAELGVDGEERVDVQFEVRGEPFTSTHIGLHFEHADNHTGNETTASDYADKGPHEGGNIPGTFDRNFTVKKVGTHYWRAHAIGSTGDVLSEERVLDVKSGRGYERCV